MHSKFNPDPGSGEIVDTTTFSSHQTSTSSALANGHEKLRDGIDNGRHRSSFKCPPVAICGMACRLPGKIHKPEDLWDFIMSKSDARSIVPPTRYNVAGYNSTHQKSGSVASQYGYFLDESVDLAGLDTSFFSFGGKELEKLDPQQRLLLEVTRECLEDAGEVGWKGKNVGVYVGSFGNDWYDITQVEGQRYGNTHVSTTHDFALSNRISYELDLRGPSMTIRTACSSGLIGLNEACMAIAKGDCESAIVSGVNIIMAPSLTTDITEQGALSPDGSCKTFSSTANGYARAEGVVSLYVKLLDDAIRDGNPIQAVIVGSATNADGKTPGFSVPSAAAQETLIRHTYKLAGIGREDIGATGFFECHGTGTPVGDPIETEAIARVFRDSGGIHIGSVKPNLGHGEAVSGLTAVLKAVLALKYRTIPPQIKCIPLTTKIPFEENQLIVPTEPTPWPEGRLNRVSVNSFGVGGANAHVIIDGYHQSTEMPLSGMIDAPQLLTYSANNAQSLEDLVAQYQTYLEHLPINTSLSNIAYTLARRREHLPFRGFTVGTVDQPGTPILNKSPTSTKVPSLVMVFTGQGAQWARMGSDLLRSNSVFRDTIKSLDGHLQQLGILAPAWTLGEELIKSARVSRMNEAEFSQPLCTALQIALVDTLAFVGVKAAAVVGHSSGEIAAAYAAGGITAKEAIVVAFHRGLASKVDTRPGSMAAVGLSWKEAEGYLVPGVVIACDNSPRSVTLSGDADKMPGVLSAISEDNPNVLATTLKVDKAYHSHHMTKAGSAYYDEMSAAGVTGKDTSIPFFSSLTGELMVYNGHGEDSFGPGYWKRNLESPVLFKSAVQNLLQDASLILSELVFLEIGPHAALSAPLRQILSEDSRTAEHIPTILRRQNSAESLLNAIGKLWTLGIDIDFAAIMPRGSCISGLPRYPWNHQRRHWFESRVSKEWRMREYPHHDLLGARVPESSGIEPAWRNLLHLDNAPWLRDHKIRSDIVFPFAGYVAIAAEGIRQLTAVQDEVELRKIIVDTALVLREEAPTELVTNFRRHRLTNDQDSTWWEFTISSYNGHTWTKHSVGQVRATLESSFSNIEPPNKLQVPHKVDPRRFYESSCRAGADYGHHFKALQDLRTSAGGAHGMAIAKTKNNWHSDESNYHLHPVIVDTYLQLVAASAHHGVMHSYKQLLPASMESLKMSRCSVDELSLFTFSEAFKSGFVGAGGAIAKSRTVLEVHGIVAFPLGDEVNPDAEQAHPITARSEWVRHIDFLALEGLLRPAEDTQVDLDALNELAQLAISLSRYRLSVCGAASPTEHMNKYREWLEKAALASVENIDIAELSNRFDELHSSLTNSKAEGPALAISKVYTNILAIVEGEVEALDILNTDGTLNRFNAFLNGIDASDFLSALAHTTPNLRVLEIGAGSGLATIDNLKALKHSSGQILYSKYVYADSLPGLIVAAKEQFKDVPNMEFAILDVKTDPANQGFQDHQFDLIIATNSADDLRGRLHHLHKLLAVDGRLILQQPRAGLTWAKYIMGTLPDWWADSADKNSDGPWITRADWEGEFKASGLQTLGSAVLESFPINTIMVAKPLAESHVPRKVSILSYTTKSEQSSQLAAELQSRGFLVSNCTLETEPPIGHDVIAFLDADRSYLDDINPQAFELLQKYICALDSTAGLFWITRPSQTHCADPSFSPLIGLARTIRSERGIDFATCEVDVLDSPTGVRAIIDVFCKFNKRVDGPMGPDFEYVISEGVTRVSRFFPFSLEEEAKSLQSPTSEARLRMVRAGRLDSMHWSGFTPADPKGDEVEIEVYTAGLNYRDVLVATGVIEPLGREIIFGYEGAGIVRRVGPDTKKVRVGDRVLVMPFDTFATVITTTELLCQKLPDEINFEDGVSMPVVYATAIHCLIDKAHLERGQSVLIHSGCGGVGLAAIQIARMIGADIYTTVSSDEKVSYLMNTFGIPRTNIFHSRDASFVHSLMVRTNNEGVDVALNSLSGELLHATWRCVAKYGIMVEIGKRDLIGAGRLDMGPFLANRTYCCVAVDEYHKERPKILDRLLRTMMEFYQLGFIRPIVPIKCFKASVPQEAFAYMQKGNHIGKVVISIRNNAAEPDTGNTVTTAKTPHTLNPAASYLLIGGLGGLGRSIALWMVQHGARHLVFLSRSAGQGNAQEEDIVRLLESMDCSVHLVAGSVTDRADVARAISHATTAAPLKGIIQMSMVLRDQAFGRMTMSDWNSATAPKVAGTWNLHNVTHDSGIALDFFLLFSSLSGIMGQPGQANYAAANTFLDAFVLYRNGLGLPCTAIDVGAVEGVGYLSENEDLLRKLQGSGWRSITEERVLEAVAEAMRPRRGEITTTKHKNTDIVVNRNNMLLGISPTVPLSSPDASARLRKDIRMSVYHNTSATSTNTSPSSQSTLTLFMSRAKLDPSLFRQPGTAALLALEIGKKLFMLLLRSEQGDPDITLGLTELGLDSMVAVEMRAWWKQAFGFEISVLEMLAMGTLDALGKRAAEVLAGMHGA